MNAQTQAALTASTLTAFELTRPASDATSVAQAGARLMSLLSGAPVVQTHVATMAASMTAATDSMDVSSASDPQVTLSYRGSNNFFVVTNEAVTNDFAAPTDVGIAAARALFTSAMNSAVSLGIVPSTGLLASNARISRAVQGEGAIGQQPVERTAEYVFTVPRTINGVEVLDAGFEVSVHRNGHLARLKTYGPTVGSTIDSSGTEVANSKGYAFVPSVPVSEVDARVQAEYPGAIVKSIGLRYWLPSGELSAITEPKQIYFVVPTAKVDGQQVHARVSRIARAAFDRGGALAAAAFPFRLLTRV